MCNRPIFSKNLSIEDFKKYYWYKTELQKICRDNKLPTQGTKAELEEYIENFLLGKECINKRKVLDNIRKNKVLTNITLDTKLIEDGFKFNNESRKFFSDYFGVDKFSFTKEMASTLRQAERDNNLNITVKDLIDIYINAKNKTNTQIQEKEEETYQWNNFVKEFCKDEKSNMFKNKLKVASIIWNHVRDSHEDKVYSSELIYKYKNELSKYIIKEVVINE